MTACFCGRAPRGFAWHDFNPQFRERRPIEHCCSLACLDLVCRSNGVPPTRDEKRAVAEASGACGEYLEKIGKTDLAQMTPDEWEGFLAHAFIAIAQEVRTIAYEEAPF